MMKRLCAAVLGAGLLMTAAALPCAAEESSEEENGKLFTSGDYTYSLMTNTNDSEKTAACIESYSGSDTDLVIPEELDGLDVIALGSYAFTSMHELETVKLPETMIQFGEYAFADCPAIKSYTVAADNPYFESKDGVLYCDGGTTLARYPLGTEPTDLTIPDGVTELGNVAFTGCVSLKSVTFPDSLKKIALSCFSDCTGLTEIELPPNLTEIGAFAFNNCTNLKSVTFPDGLRTIGNAAFAATALESVKLPEGLETIGQQAFCETKLTTVLIPESVTDIGFSAFGWGAAQNGELIMDKSFIISGVAGSVAEEYANDADAGNSFKFIAIESGKDELEAGGGIVDHHDDDRDAVTASAAEQENDPQNGVSGVVRIIGIVVCAVLILLILIVAVFSGKGKDSKKTAGQPEKTEPDKEEPKNSS